MGRPPCCDKSNVKKGPWTAEEDAKILAYVASHGTGNWTLVPQKAGLNRCGKSCRLRWTNYLRPDLKHDNFTPEEEELILDYHKAIGSRWSLIAKRLPGRTDNDVKNHWNTKLKKKLSKMGIDPLTHKPISQLLSDYGNVNNDLPIKRNQIGPSNIVPKFEPPPPLIPTDHFSSDYTPIEQFHENPFPTNNNLAHPQIINRETIQPHFFNQVVPSSSSSYFSQASRPQASLPSSPSTWNEFLNADPPLSANREREHEYDYQGMLSSNISSLSVHSEVAQSQFTGESANRSNEIKMEGPTSSSFVDAILERDSEMQLEFPQILDVESEYCELFDLPKQTEG